MDYNYMEYAPYLAAQGIASLQSPQPPQGFLPQPPRPPQGFPPQPSRPPQGFPPKPPRPPHGFVPPVCTDASCMWGEMPYYRTTPGMPYHMAHPFPLFAQADEDEKDLEKLHSMLPEVAQVVRPVIEDECDRMEYDGSLMFDEYPDKRMIERLVERIYQTVQNSAQEEGEPQEEGIFASSCRNCNANRFGDGLSDLIQVMLFEEMHRRRCRHRKCKRWW